MVITAIVNGNVTVKPGVQAVVGGIVKGNVVGEAGSVIFLTGIVDGDVQLDGSASVTGLVKGVSRVAPCKGPPAFNV